MGRTLIVIRNLLKAWGCLAVLLLVLGAIGWELGGYRLLVLACSKTLRHSNRSGWARVMRCQSGWNWNQPARCEPTSA